MYAANAVCENRPYLPVKATNRTQRHERNIHFHTPGRPVEHRQPVFQPETFTHQKRKGEGMNGYAGKILRVDLSNSKTGVIPTRDYEQWVGGHGMGSAIFFDLVRDKTISGFNAANVVTIMTSPLCGTLVPAGSGRTEVQGIGISMSMDLTRSSGTYCSPNLPDGHRRQPLKRPLKLSRIKWSLFKAIA